MANPLLVPLETGISFATFGIQERASLGINPWQIIFLSLTPHPHFLPLLRLPLIHFTEYIIHRDVKTSSIWESLERTLSVWNLTPFLRRRILCLLSGIDFADCWVVRSELCIFWTQWKCSRHYLRTTINHKVWINIPDWWQSTCKYVYTVVALKSAPPYCENGAPLPQLQHICAAALHVLQYNVNIHVYHIRNGN